MSVYLLTQVLSLIVWLNTGVTAPSLASKAVTVASVGICEAQATVTLAGTPLMTGGTLSIVMVTDLALVQPNSLVVVSVYVVVTLGQALVKLVSVLDKPVEGVQENKQFKEPDAPDRFTHSPLQMVVSELASVV